MTAQDQPLQGRVALVAGATRGAGRGIAVELGAAGATVYCTGRTTRAERSEMDRPETIEETAELVDAAGGTGIAVPVDHLDPGQVAALVERIEAEQGALDVLVNDIWGATKMEWNATVWESDLDDGLHLLRLGIDTHAITSHFALPLLIRQPGGLVVEVTDGTDELQRRELPGVVLLRRREGRGPPDGVRARPRAGAARRDRRAADAGMAPVRGDARRLRGHRGELARRDAASSRTSPSPRARRSSAARSRPSLPIPTCRAGTASRCRAVSSPGSTGSPTSTAASPTPGATWSRSRTPASRPTPPATADHHTTLVIPDGVVR